MNQAEIEESGKAMAHAEQTLDAIKIFEDTPMCDRQAVMREAVKAANDLLEYSSSHQRYLASIEITADQTILELNIARPVNGSFGPLQLLPFIKATIPTAECKELQKEKQHDQ